jgi:hypothetical protein
METPTEQSNILSAPTHPGESPEVFAPPGITDLASLTDGRQIGDFRSAYPFSAWIQIICELTYLITFLVLSFTALVLLAKYVVLEETTGPVYALIGEARRTTQLVVWAAVTLSGACGGCASSLKWLYHAVAKKRWHRDRIVWRLIVPVLSATLSVFAGLMIISGLIPFLSKAPLTAPGAGAAFGFFVGFFSDNVLAGLQKVAYRMFGTLDKGSPPADSESEVNHAQR